MAGNGQYSESLDNRISSRSRLIQGLLTPHSKPLITGFTQVGGSQHGTPCLEELRAFGIWERSVEASERQGGRQLGWCGANLG